MILADVLPGPHAAIMQMGMNVLRRWRLLLAAVLLVIAGGATANEFAAPLITSVPLSGDETLTLRFAVANRGWLFTIHDVDFTCVPDQVTGRDATGGVVKVHGVAFPLNVDIDLGPRASFQYTCPIQGPHLPTEVEHIIAHVEMAYTRFGRRSEAHSAELIWDGQSKIWTAAP